MILVLIGLVFLSLLLHSLYCYWTGFIDIGFAICLHISAQGHWNWFMLLALIAQLNNFRFQPKMSTLSWSKRGKQFANLEWALSLIRCYQDHGFWLVCLHQLDLLLVKWPVKVCEWGFIFCHLPMGSWIQGFRKNQ